MACRSPGPSSNICTTMSAVALVCHPLSRIDRSVAARCRRSRNLNVSVQEWNDEVVFLHKIVPGAADKSYGIHVARLAGVPRPVNERAKQILSQLENEHLDSQGRPKIGAGRSGSRRGDIQLTLFAPAEHPLMDTIRQTDVDRLTPLDALQLIQKWKDELRED